MLSGKSGFRVAEATTPMSSPLTRKFTLNDLRRAREGGAKVAMLTCYDYTTARLMQEAGVPALLVGDSAGNVVLGYSTTLPVSLAFMIEITAAVRRGAPMAFVVADMPFGSYHGIGRHGACNVVRMVQRTGCDCVKLEVAAAHLDLVSRSWPAAGVAVMGSSGFSAPAVGQGWSGGYRTQGRTAEEAVAILALSLQMQRAERYAALVDRGRPDRGRQSGGRCQSKPNSRHRLRRRPGLPWARVQ